MDRVCEFPLPLLGSPWRKFTICTTSPNMNTSDHLFTLPAEFVRAPWAANYKTNTNTNHQRLCLPSRCSSEEKERVEDHVTVT